MRNFSWTVLAGAVALSLVSCQKAQTPPAQPAPDYHLVGTIKDIMQGIVDPSSDVIFDSVATNVTAAGIEDKRPQTDEEWATVQHNALMLAEAANLLKIPGRQVARPGEKTKSEGPDAPELTAEEISAKINGDRGKFYGHANELQQTAIRAMQAAQKHDVQGLFDVGDDIDMACEGCHIEYWYPKDSAARAAYEEAVKEKAAEKAKAQQQGPKK
jgi:hypothetical protein